MVTSTRTRTRTRTTKYTNTKKRSWNRGYPSRNSKIVIVEYRCEMCRLTMGVRPSNQQQEQEQEIVCSRCGKVIAISKARKVSKLETPHRNTETLISTTPMPNYGDVAIKKPANYRGAFKLLSEKGIK